MKSIKPMTSERIEAERELFKQVTKHKLGHQRDYLHPDHYWSAQTQHAWFGWKARAATDKSDELRAEIGLLRKISVRLYNSGYHAGHDDTVEGGFTDVHVCDMDTYHDDAVSELIEHWSEDD